MSLDLDRLTKGIDNLHIDVALSPSFQLMVTNLIEALVTQELETGLGGAKRSGAAFQPWEEFRQHYAALVESAIHQAKSREGIPLVQAAQLAAIKWIWERVHASLDETRQDLRRRMASASTHEEHRLLEWNEQLAWLTRQRAKLTARILRQFLKAILKAEDGPLGDLRASLLGVRWALPRTLLANPLILAEHPFDEDTLIAHYVWIKPGQPHDSDSTYSYAAMERRLAAWFPNTADFAWIDNPANVALLLEQDLAAEHLTTAARSDDHAGRTLWLGQRRFQRRMLATLERPLRRTGVLPQILAALEVAALAKPFAQVCSPDELHQFLLGKPPRKPFPDKQRKLGKESRRRLDRLSHRQEQALLVKFLMALLTFRRDLALLQRLRHALGLLTLRHEPQEHRLSRANRTLYEFGAIADTSAQAIQRHAILKADIRGSTRVVDEMRTRGLNPATHFSLHFFEPLNQVIREYGAEKVFLEGDAVILAIAEHDGAVAHHYSVARLCGIGAKLLELMQTQNQACRANGLPELELGIGLAYCATPPTVLFDGNRPIMISPAIGKADRLSSCSWTLRTLRAAGSATWMNVELYQIPEGDPLRGDKGEGCLRYNVNGIELDADGFAKLQTELPLHEITLQVPGDQSPTTFFSGRYPAPNGALHSLLIRRGTTRRFDRAHPQLGTPGGAVFYEVVVAQHIHALVAGVLALREHSSGVTPPPQAA